MSLCKHRSTLIFRLQKAFLILAFRVTQRSNHVRSKRRLYFIPSISGGRWSGNFVLVLAAAHMNILPSPIIIIFISLFNVTFIILDISWRRGYSCLVLVSASGRGTPLLFYFFVVFFFTFSFSDANLWFLVFLSSTANEVWYLFLGCAGFVSGSLLTFSIPSSKMSFKLLTNFR